ncbi:hypothetical protein SAMN05444407_109136 [Chryseobacterium contaminans]|uniref:Uncharacterized protein n=1 Tax=Chryseobacterium contaminans TaxID=1423959 RepID=A0A1M7G129_9FLAO|nr:hypothetical protein SAMN05444407_109136 [Chryseobacterium contaminans]
MNYVSLMRDKLLQIKKMAAIAIFILPYKRTFVYHEARFELYINPLLSTNGFNHLNF